MRDYIGLTSCLAHKECRKAQIMQAGPGNDND